MELSSDQVGILETRLKRCIQDSITTYTPVRLVKEGVLHGFRVWTDAWPDFNVVIVSPGKSLVKNEFLKKKVCVYCPVKYTRLKSLLVKEGVIEWKTPFKMNGVSEEIKTIADNIFNNCQSEFCRINNVSITARLDAHCYLYKVTEKELKHIPKPEGVTVGLLTEDIVHHVSRAWKFKQDGIENYMKILISMNQPSVCLFNKDEEPVAWAIEQVHGTNGMLHVKPDYRRRGLAQYTQYLLSRKIIQRDGYAFVTIETDNYISMALHEKLGFRKTENEELFWKEYTVNDNFT